MKGPKGDDGAQGIQGIQGIQGEKGEQGEQGEKGDTGPAGSGPAAASVPTGYTPVMARYVRISLPANSANNIWKQNHFPRTDQVKVFKGLDDVPITKVTGEGYGQNTLSGTKGDNLINTPNPAKYRCMSNPTYDREAYGPTSSTYVDVGEIMHYGTWEIDLGEDQDITTLALHNGFGNALRGTTLNVEHRASFTAGWTFAGKFNYVAACVCKWHYFNLAQLTNKGAAYVSLEFKSATLHHAPRIGEIQLIDENGDDIDNVDWLPYGNSNEPYNQAQWYSPVCNDAYMSAIFSEWLSDKKNVCPNSHGVVMGSPLGPKTLVGRLRLPAVVSGVKLASGYHTSARAGIFEIRTCDKVSAADRDDYFKGCAFARGGANNAGSGWGATPNLNFEWRTKTNVCTPQTFRW
jgi:hypothetical protein